MNLSLAIPKEEDRKPGVNYFWLDMQDPDKRRAFLDVVFYRRYQQSLADWEPANPGKFALYLRKDLAGGHEVAEGEAQEGGTAAAEEGGRLGAHGDDETLDRGQKLGAGRALGDEAVPGVSLVQRLEHAAKRVGNVGFVGHG